MYLYDNDLVRKQTQAEHIIPCGSLNIFPSFMRDYKDKNSSFNLFCITICLPYYSGTVTKERCSIMGHETMFKLLGFITTRERIIILKFIIVRSYYSRHFKYMF